MDIYSHGFGPVWDARSHTLILGSFPSPRSRAEGFYYAHPQNRFWRVLGAVFASPVPQTVEEKKAFVLAHGLALWDVAERCCIEGARDETIRSVEPTDLSLLLRAAPITRIFTNGAASGRLYRRYHLPQTGMPAHALPSTSAANAAWDLKRLTEAWQILKGECL